MVFQPTGGRAETDFHPFVFLFIFPRAPFKRPGVKLCLPDCLSESFFCMVL